MMVKSVESLFILPYEAIELFVVSYVAATDSLQYKSLIIKKSSTISQLDVVMQIDPTRIFIKWNNKLNQLNTFRITFYHTRYISNIL